jgi:DNA-binding transcriptional regulator YhcF (GntR family)
MSEPAIRAPAKGGSDEYALAIDRGAEVPIGVQLGWALRTRIGDGRLVPGQRLPGLRELAETIGVNANTVRAVYQRLEREGLIDSQQGSGTFVASVPPASGAGAIAANAAREALRLGVDPREVAAALYVSSESSSAPADEPARRRLLRTQIAALERTLGELEAKHPGVAPAPANARKGPGPTLLGAHELEQVRAQLVRRLATVQAAIDDLGGKPDAGAKRGGAGARAKGRQKSTVTKTKRTSRSPAGPQAKPRAAPAGA